MQRAQSPICKGTLKPLSYLKCGRYCRFFSLKLFNSENFYCFLQYKKNNFQNQKHWYLIHTQSDKAFKCTVNSTFTSITPLRACKLMWRTNDIWVKGLLMCTRNNFNNIFEVRKKINHKKWLQKYLNIWIIVI